MKIKLVDDKEKVASVREALKENEGYSPCRLEKTPDNKCMCKEFRESTEIGECHCGLYEKVDN